MSPTESRPASTPPASPGPPRRLGWSAGAVAAVAAAFLVVTGVPGTRPARAQLPAHEPYRPQFAKFGKTYVNLSLATHVIRDPGFGLPPGTMQVYFGAQSYINLYGEEAEALRRLLEEAPPPAAYAAQPAAAPAAGTAAPAAGTAAPVAKAEVKKTRSAPVKKAAPPPPPAFDQP